MKNLSFLILFSIVFLSCDEDINPITFEVEEFNNTYEADISVVLERAEESNEIGKRINNKVTDTIIAIISEEAEENLKAVLSNFNKDYLEFKREFLEDERPWTLNIESEVTYQSPEIITIALNTYIDKGGAHGNDVIQFLNFDPKTGKLFKQSEIIKNQNDFKALAENYLKKSMQSKTIEDEPSEDFFFGKPFQLPENIGFSDDGLILLYNVYEIASYHQGFTEFAIPFDIVEPYLNVR